MKLSPAVIDAMLLTGCSAEQIAAAVKAAMRVDDESVAERREKDRVRKREERAIKKVNKNNDSVQSVQRTPQDNEDTPSPDKEKPPTPPKEINPIPDPSSLRSEERSPSKRPHRMPDDFHPDIDFAVSQGMTRSEAIAEVERMRDWSKSSPKGTKLDWPAMWRGWVRRRMENKPPDPRRPKPKNEFMQRQQNIKDQLVRDISGEIDEFTGQTFDLSAADYRAH